MKQYRKVNSDLPALLDEWATSLFRELDYVREANNGVRFKKLYGDLEVCFRVLLGATIKQCKGLGEGA